MMKMKLVAAVWCGCWLAVVSGRETSDCYTLEDNPYLYFSTKTAYELVRGKVVRDVKYEDSNGCEAQQLWMIIRHGTLYPGKATIQAMHKLEGLRANILQNHDDQYNGRLCYADIDKLREWTLNVTLTDAKYLTKQGRTDMYFLAKHFRTKFPNLFAHGYTQDRYVFRHTKTERTQESARSFAEGLFGSTVQVWIPEPFENDTLLAPYENCTLWQNEIKKNNTHFKDLENFRDSLLVQNLNHNVSQRLGFTYNLAFDTIMLMYDMCRYDKAWHFADRSPWCAAFIAEELKILEYYHDLKKFYESGYGSELNWRLGCTPLQDMLKRFEEVLDEGSESAEVPRAVFYFTHANMINMLLTRMNIASRGYMLRYYNYEDQRNRQYRTSKLLPFAANIAAVLLKCERGEQDRVMFYHNGNLIHFPDCEAGICSWERVQLLFRDASFQHCDLGWCNGASFAHIPTFLVAALGVAGKLLH